MAKLRIPGSLPHHEICPMDAIADPPKKRCKGHFLCFVIALTLGTLLQGWLESVVDYHNTVIGLQMQKFVRFDDKFVSVANQVDTTAVTTTTTSPSPLKEIHLLFGLSGNNTDFLAEFEVALKSVLLNAPFQSSLTIHIMADWKAYHSLKPIFDRTQVRTWKTRMPITITTYNVQWKQRDWDKVVRRGMPGFFKFQHTFGAFFRLFAHDVLPKDVKQVVYMDPDVVLMANLEELWKNVAPDPWFHIGASMCSGFLIINVKKLEELWDYLPTLDMVALSETLKQQPNDQLIFRAINYTKPEVVGLLPPEWDINVADGIRHLKDTIVRRRPEIGMMHFNGASGTKGAYFEAHNYLTDPKYEASWGLAHYYERLPWTWARFIAKSVIDGEGHVLQVKHGRPRNATHNETK